MRILVTGGCGFIGSNAAVHFDGLGHDVILVDNLSRCGSAEHARELEKLPRTRLIVADLLDDDPRWLDAVKSLGDGDAIIHLAGQVAVTTSVADPIGDFKLNALATLNVLEAVRAARGNPAFIFSSTNKVYGELASEALGETTHRYTGELVERGIAEGAPLDFHSPYGCSKGAADQYVRDYARIYGLRTVVFRQSCIYGVRQFGVEDQGWLAWFTIAGLLGWPATVYGTGRQVRDALCARDLNRSFEAAIDRIDRVAGEIFNIGGGPGNTLSILELLDVLDSSFGIRLSPRFDVPRPGDQRVYVSDLAKAKRHLDWEPRVGLAEGIAEMHDWCASNIDVIRALVGS